MGAVYKSICFEVDSLMLLVDSLTEKEVQLKIDIEGLLNEGYANLAKARYLMGSTCVSKIQLPTENSHPLKPVATVCRQEVNDCWVFKIMRRPLHRRNEVTETEVCKDQTNDSVDSIKCLNSSSEESIPSTRSERAFKAMLQGDPQLIRKSKTAFLIKDDIYQDCQNDLLDEISNTDSEESVMSISDPIRLFGVLVPGTLKEAQLQFIDVVNLLGDCATIQSQLRETLQKLIHLKKVKHLIEEAAKEAKVDFLTPKVYWTPSARSSVSCSPIEEEGESIEQYKAPSVPRKSIRSVLFDEKDTGGQVYQEAEYSGFDSDY